MDRQPMRGDILRIGFTGTAEDGRPFTSSWAFKGGDYAGVDVGTGSQSGWSYPEQKILADVAQAWGEDVALTLAAALRARPAFDQMPTGRHADG